MGAIANKRIWKVILLITAFLGVLVVGYHLWHKNPPEATTDPYNSPFSAVSGNSLMPISLIYIPHVEIYADLIGCLVLHESNGNPNAYNPYDSDGREKFGCLQFGQIEFEDFCVNRYKLKNNIFDCNIQRICADKMIDEGYAKKWGTLNKCLDNKFD